MTTLSRTEVDVGMLLEDDMMGKRRLLADLMIQVKCVDGQELEDSFFLIDMCRNRVE